MYACCVGDRVRDLTVIRNLGVIKVWLRFGAKYECIRIVFLLAQCAIFFKYSRYIHISNYGPWQSTGIQLVHIKCRTHYVTHKFWWSSGRDGGMPRL
jgi:hypothetical protein